ncbi:MAG: type III-B CRISPR module RAMP protein Cmr1 [Methanoregula sp.]|nr:type III-B CRISPR module RAMP protein Cmr1 [Methanoregula sp.]
MARTIQTCPPQPEGQIQNKDVVIPKPYEIQVITPLFGGGIEAGKVDPVMPVRPSGIRGHLRFWWRATRGSKYPDYKELFQRESEIWGSTENPSPVTITVSQKVLSSFREFPRYGFADNSGPESYVIFPAKDKKESLGKENFSFILNISWLSQKRLQDIREKENQRRAKENKSPKPEHVEDIGPDVEAALRAWVNFGGIGARTRRGCGALYSPELSFHSIEDAKEYPFQVLYKSGNPGDTPIQTWSNAINVFRNFRQLRKGGLHTKNIRTRNGVRPITVPKERSWWPEPDSIRQITGCSLKPLPTHLNPRMDHSASLTSTQYFPRAELGLPIIFHFADGPEKWDPPNNDLDPPESTLIPTKLSEDHRTRKDGTRMASPVILRPLKLNNGSCLSIYVILQHPNLPPLRLTGKHPNLPKDLDPNIHVVNEKIAKYLNSPLGPVIPGGTPRSQKGSALDAFIAYATEEMPDRNFKEVGK